MQINYDAIKMYKKSQLGYLLYETAFYEDHAGLKQHKDK